MEFLSYFGPLLVAYIVVLFTVQWKFSRPGHHPENLVNALWCFCWSVGSFWVGDYFGGGFNGALCIAWVLLWWFFGGGKNQTKKLLKKIGAKTKAIIAKMKKFVEQAKAKSPQRVPGGSYRPLPA